MSRIGRKPIQIPEKVEVKIEGDLILIKGPKGELKNKLPAGVTVEKNGQELIVKVKDETDKKYRSLWGTWRQLINNMLVGVTQGFEKKLEINGIGFRAEVRGKELVLNVGYSHPVNYAIPQGLEIKVDKNTIIVTGFDKQLVGETAAQIRQIKKPEPYKGKGIRYFDEVVRRKAGKQVKSATIAK